MQFTRRRYHHLSVVLPYLRSITKQSTYLQNQFSTLLKGAELIKSCNNDFEDADKTGTTRIHRYFCEKCGSRLWITNPHNAKFMGERSTDMELVAESKGGKWKSNMEFFNARCWDWVSIEQSATTKFEIGSV